MMFDSMWRDVNLFVWSHETCMFVNIDYSGMLYRFIGIESGCVPDLIDGNRQWFPSPQ